MKKSRGRPKGKKYPQPHTTAEGFDIATYGGTGGTEAMSILRDCPYPAIKFVEDKHPTHRYRHEDYFSRLAPTLAEAWVRRIGPIIGQKIASGDVEFFRQLANAVEESSKTEREIENPLRYLAIGYKYLFCDLTGIPFTRKGLGNFYRSECPGQTIRSSTLSKLFKWAQSSAKATIGDENTILRLIGPQRSEGSAQKS